MPEVASAVAGIMRRMKVPVGVTSIIGYVLGVLQLGAAVVLYLNGEHSAASEALTSGTATHILVAAGRYLQAHKQIATTVAHVESALTAGEQVVPSLQDELAAPPQG